MIRLSRLVPFLLALVFLPTAHSAEIELIDLPGDVDIVSLRGEIVSGDSARFYQLVERHDRVTVILESPGGLVNEALRIGAEIRMRNFATMVASGGECYSACGLIWIAGARRYMSNDSQIGFHAAYREENGEYRESGVANAEIGSFLTHLGLRIEAIRFFTVAGPDEFLLLTPERARVLGIDVFEQEGEKVTSPHEAPTADLQASRFVSLSILQARCSGFFDPDLTVIGQGQRAAFDEGNRLVGSEKWIELWTPMLDEVKAEMSAKGDLVLCLETEADLRYQAQPTGVTGPSFNCVNAVTATEKAICVDADLWAKDRAMNAIYLLIKAYENANVRKTILTDQRAWLRTRDACSADIECLRNSYDERLEVFKDIHVPS